MKKPVTQEDLLGCGVACVAFVCEMKYQIAKKKLFKGLGSANRTGYYCKHLVKAFARAGREYDYQYLKRKREFKENEIVFIKRSKKDPTGHYFVRVKGGWMDSWINFVENSDINDACSGFKKRLPGKAIYAVYPR